MFKSLHGNVPASVSQLFRSNNEYHNYNTRKCAHIHAPVEELKQAFDYLGIYYWNHISQKVKINTSYPLFQKSCKSVYPKFETQ